jgi:2-oxoisovalerate dehydrogenase E1 component beta subunit
LIASTLERNDPVIFMEPKILYRAAEEYVPVDAFTLPLDRADVVKNGDPLTVISYGQPMYLCSTAVAAIEQDLTDVSMELIDLRSIYPRDRNTILRSLEKTGRAVVHEVCTTLGLELKSLPPYKKAHSSNLRRQ